MSPGADGAVAAPPNPLLAEGALPAFGAIAPAHVGPALDALLADAEAALALAAGAAHAADYDALAATLDLPVERLERAWGTVCHLQAVVDTPALRAAHAALLPRVTDFFTRLGADEGLFAKTRALAEGAAFEALSPQRRKVVRDALRDAVLGGAALQGAARERFAAIQARSAELSQRFGDNLLDATDAWSLTVDESRLAGVPADVVQAARAAALAAGDTVPGACRLTLHAPCRVPVLAHAEDRALRETLHRAKVTLASEFGPAGRDNGPLMRELLALRHEEAALLGHACYAEAALVPKMAGSPAEVLAFLRDLATRARPVAEAERDALQAFAREALGLDVLRPWDLAFASERLKRRLHGFDDEALRPWFPAPRVLEGLFGLVHELFGVELRPAEAPAWHADVRHFEVRRDGAPLGGLWLDPHARPGKQAGAWMDELRARWRRPDGRLQTPLAVIVCNFPAPVGDRPALLSHDEVLTLFHEFGHALHHLLTRVDERAVAGIAGVEWDAVELPSQFMENFAWEWPVLQRLSAHVDDGTPLPRALFERLLGARRFQAGLQVLRMVESALFDMRLHTEPGAAERVLAIAREVHAEVGLLPRDADDRWPNGFDHVFDGGYAAGYYGYHWAEVLSADAYEAIGPHPATRAAAGAHFRTAVLETGGSRPALDSFVEFRGRAPRIEPFLRQQGLAVPPLPRVNAA
jgi:oligopeptidase A